MQIIDIPYDLSKLSIDGLRNSITNFRRHNKDAWVVLALRELNNRGAANKNDYSQLKWNQDVVKKVLDPFRQIAVSVVKNKRTSYTEAGGYKFRPKDHPEKLWIDTYCAFKTELQNVAFGCHIKEPGDDPKFYIEINGLIEKYFKSDEIDMVILRFKELASKA